MKEIQEKLFEEKFLKENTKKFLLSQEVSSLKLSMFGAISGVFFLLTLIFPFNIDTIGYSFVFADKVFIPDSVVIGGFFIILSILVSFLSIIYSFINNSFISLFLSLAILSTVFLSVNSMYTENKPFFSIVLEKKCDLISIKKKK